MFSFRNGLDDQLRRRSRLVHCDKGRVGRCDGIRRAEADDALVEAVEALGTHEGVVEQVAIDLGLDEDEVYEEDDKVMFDVLVAETTTVAAYRQPDVVTFAASRPSVRVRCPQRPHRMPVQSGGQATHVPRRRLFRIGLGAQRPALEQPDRDVPLVLAQAAEHADGWPQPSPGVERAADHGRLEAVGGCHVGCVLHHDPQACRPKCGHWLPDPRGRAWCRMGADGGWNPRWRI